MKAVGVIVEYNPFHNGHAFHLRASKEASKADIVIAAMSGNFLQRGEPALVSKWYRTRMALMNGADLVFELPYGFAVQHAQNFANGAVSMLTAAGCDFLCFGSESGEIDSFFKTIHFLQTQQKTYNDNIKRLIDTGVSYPKAASLAFHQLPSSGQFLDLAKPNNILGFHYIKAILDQNSSITPLTITRKNANYHDEHFASETIASATSIRKAIFSSENHDVDVGQYVPAQTKQLLNEYFHHYGLFHRWENYWRFLQYRLLQSTAEELREIYEVEEGLENRLIAAALEASSFLEFMEKLKTKRYTWTRLQRMCVHILTNATKTEMARFSDKASYLRLLGMSTAGKEYLNRQKKLLALPLVSKLSAYKQEDILLDVKAARIYNMAIPFAQTKNMLQQEYSHPPIYIAEKDR
ncbi:nucleotidyltransferase [Neobacillus niacini]|uniref:nucleotidyltransferase n=1 Tax=Neobacillus niacini TaxID=86668 RepID=UPI0021CB239B|nr:nucleotidyltransferase [Neobacillus niacini]MCM3768569.1 nucleotidyltransferase [Neobacillus niacini]